MIELTNWAEARGWKVAWGPLSVLEQVRSDIERLSASGEIDRQFEQQELRVFEFPPAEKAGAHAARVLVLAVPRPAHTITFELENGALETLAPPTYVHYSRLPESVRQLLLADVFPAETRLEPLAVPLKALAARLGLVRYGLNNLSYISGMGSYFQLVGYRTDGDLPLPAGWSPAQPQALPECEACGLCRSACPAAAIRSEKFLLRADLCLTLFTENAGDCPQDRLPAGHRCLVGCLECQETCPHNAGLLRIEPSGVVFDREETQALLAGGPVKDVLACRIRSKLERLALAHYEPVLARNLANVLAVRRRHAHVLGSP